ncbi:MAG: phosphatidate cytidylyltransferase [Clostridia bacterium]|nr:phosphatidate cytidylyltransferase [Clostridia bacterium]
MKERFIGAGIMLPLLILVYLGGYFMIAAGFAIGIIGVKEFYGGFVNMGFKPSYAVGYGAIFALYAINLWMPGNYQIVCAWLVLVVLTSILYIFKIDEHKAEDAMATIVGIVYVGFFTYHVVLVDQSAHREFVWLILIIAFSTDIFAYFAGLALGKHTPKLCPNLSPKKTWAGAVGGTLGAIICSAVFGYFLCPDLLVHCLILALVGSPIAQIGDLSASAFKRKMGIKDYGNLIPGHGGVMDRFDSVIMVAPLVYYYIAFVL